jgi:hypothetical protein
MQVQRQVELIGTRITVYPELQSLRASGLLPSVPVYIFSELLSF